MWFQNRRAKQRRLCGHPTTPSTPTQLAPRCDARAVVIPYPCPRGVGLSTSPAHQLLQQPSPHPPLPGYFPLADYHSSSSTLPRFPIKPATPFPVPAAAKSHLLKSSTPVGGFPVSPSLGLPTNPATPLSALPYDRRLSPLYMPLVVGSPSLTPPLTQSDAAAAVKTASARPRPERVSTWPQQARAAFLPECVSSFVQNTPPGDDSSGDGGWMPHVNYTPLTGGRIHARDLHRIK